MKKFAVLFYFSLIFISCEKDYNRVIENPDSPLLYKVLIGGEVYQEYSYNNANLVIEEKSKFHYSRHFYNYDNQLVKSDFYWDESMLSSSSSVFIDAMSRTEWVNPSNTPKSISHVLDYDNNGQLIKKSLFRVSDNRPEYSEFIYDNGRIFRQTWYWQNLKSVYTDYIYDAKGNLVKESKYSVSPQGIETLMTTKEYEYDDMNNPFHIFNRLLIPGKYTNVNNIIKETYKLHFDVDLMTEKVQVANYTYEYNSKGYPVKVNDVTEYIYR